MDTLRIKALLLAAKYKSLSKAAEEFSYTPSALSHSVDFLENELGVKLLYRSHTGVEFSEEGKLLCEKLTAVLEAENELIKAASAIKDSKNNQLRIGTYSSVAVNLLPEILIEFKKQYPQISISITEGNRIGDWLENNQADVLFGVENEQYEWLPIVKDDFVAVVPENLFLGRESICYEELYPFSFIATENSAVTKSVDLSKFKEIINVSSENDISAVSMVKKGIGVTILPSLVLNEQQIGVHILRLQPNLYRTLGISYKRGQHASLGAMKFIKYLKTKYNI